MTAALAGKIFVLSEIFAVCLAISGKNVSKITENVIFTKNANRSKSVESLMSVGLFKVQLIIKNLLALFLVKDH